MQKFTLKTLLLVVAVAAIAIAASVWGFDAYKQYTFQKRIEPAWAEAPVSSTLAPIKDQNNIVIYFEGDTLTLATSSSSAGLEKCDSGGDFRYDLNCSLGKFRVTFFGNTFNDLTSLVSSEMRPFDVLRDSLMLDTKSRASTAPLWVVRTQFMPAGCNSRLQHFETPEKMGFISGTKLDRQTNRVTLMFLFDSSGEYSVSVLPIDDEKPDWDKLAGQLVLKKHPQNGE